MNVILKENERIDDLELNNLKIIQNEKSFCFGMDAILLSDYASKIKKNSIVMDLGTGTGILPILLSAKTDCKKIYGIEIQENIAEMASRSIKLNNLEEKIQILNLDILELKSNFPPNSMDAIVTNPPYKKINTGIKNDNKEKFISRHETSATLETFIKSSFYLLRDKGEFYMVHRPERLVDILFFMRKFKIEPKQLRFVCPNKNSPPELILIKGIKNGNSFLKVDKNLYIYDGNSNYTDEFRKIYNK